jgi:hypothetical protein
VAAQIAERHYPKVPGLIRRSKGDMSAESIEVRSTERSVLLEPGPQNPQLISSAHGDFRELLFTIPSYAASPEQENPLAEVYRDLLQKLPKTTALLVMTHQAVASTVQGWLDAAGFPQARVVAVPDHLHFSIWAEDGYVIVKDGTSGETFFVEPYEFPRYGDGLIADFVSHQTNFHDTQAPLYFQGGNVLIGDDFFLIGADYPANSLRYINRVILPKAGESSADAVRRLYREYLDGQRTLHYIESTAPVPAETERRITVNGETWTELLYLGNRPGTVQPLFHIDMFLTLAGRDETGRYQVLVGDPRMAATTLGVPVWPHSMVNVFDSIAEALRSKGFAVVRNPLPLAYVDDSSTRERIWYFATANNALVQIAQGGAKDVWLPSYGFGNWPSLALTDTQNKRIWESLGFRVQMLGDFHPFAENLGAVHCIKKYLARG